MSNRTPPSRFTRLIQSTAFALPLLGTIAASTARAEDWPRWRGSLGTGEVLGADALLESLPADLKAVWRIPVGGGFASPVVSGERLVFLDDQEGRETVHVLESTTGRQLWQADLDSSHKDGFGTGPRCTPLIDEDRVYAQSARGELRCFSLGEGKVLWRKNYVDDFGAVYIGEKGKAAGASRHGASGAPFVEGESLIAQVGGGQGSSVVAFNKRSGEVMWKSQDDQTAYAGLLVAPVAGGRQVLCFTAEALIGLSPGNGNLLWRVPLKTSLGRHVTTPVVAGDVVMVASHQIGLTASRIVRDGNGGFTAEEAWANRTLGFNFSSPVVVGEHVYGLAPGKKVVCVDAKTGQAAWEQGDLVQTSADKAEASFLVFQGRILMLNDTGELILFAADPSAYRELARLQVCGKTWCNPAYARGRLYVRDDKELVCAELKPR